MTDGSETEDKKLVSALAFESLFDDARNMADTLRKIDRELSDAAQCDRTFFKTHHPSAADMAWEVLKASANRLSNDGCFDDEEPDSDDECFVD